MPVIAYNYTTNISFVKFVTLNSVFLIVWGVDLPYMLSHKISQTLLFQKSDRKKSVKLKEIPQLLIVMPQH